jgi:glc operon protein GlcG
MNATRFLGVGLMVAAAASAAHAQVAERKVLTLDGARRVIAAATAQARRNHAGGVIAVVDEGGNLMALERLDGTFAAGANISIGKARTAVLFKRPTHAFEDIIKNGRTAMVALNDFTPLQGGIPIVVDSQVVGGVGVSGAASAQQDEELAIAGANAITDPGAVYSSGTPPEPTLYFDKSQVAASFAKGGVLVGATEGRNYMVHTSRRDKDGMAEVHALDTDIIYVTEGSVDFVTGGTVTQAKAIAPDEVRGAGIQGGQTRRLSKGDVIVVPNGTPHQFVGVRGAFTYYTVKVR